MFNVNYTYKPNPDCHNISTVMAYADDAPMTGSPHLVCKCDRIDQGMIDSKGEGCVDATSAHGYGVVFKVIAGNLPCNRLS